ncbi:MAG: N-6 DNA methylase, partial [Capsulimonadaceae bacterium]
PALQDMLTRLAAVNFDVTRKDPATTRDLFKGLYQVFVPRELRHALGEVYTPDWLAAHAMDLVNWNTDDDLLDPTCGTGTFLLEAVKRRIEQAHRRATKPTATDLLRGIHGIDLNPLAVLAARASLVVFLAPFKREDEVIRLPVFLADAINSATADGRLYRHTLQTEIGSRTFSVPEDIVHNIRFHDIFARLRDLVNADLPASQILKSVIAEFGLSFSDADQATAFADTVQAFVSMHKKGWNGIWCPILADRFAAGAIGKVTNIVGNPPWVKWSNLPPEYADFIKPICLRLGVFSPDKWVGGIESDISTIVTFESARKWLKNGGTLAFFITGTVFANESSEGFRRFDRVDCTVERVEDYQQIAPFEGVTNFPTLLVLRRVEGMAKGTQFWPIPYTVYEKLIEDNRPVRTFRSALDFRHRAHAINLTAAPVPGTEAGPWLKGTWEQQDEWKRIFDGSAKAVYTARKGVTTDANGIFFVKPIGRVDESMFSVVNDPTIGRRNDVPRVQSTVEGIHLFPLLRGRGITAFSATIDPKYCVLVPQRGMHGDPNLPQTAPKTFAFLSNFRKILESRSSLRRFQSRQAWWSLWSTGAYTFSPYKVLWREMGGHSFASAYVGTVSHPILGNRIPIADHKLYFIPVDTEDEAAFLTAILNAPKVAAAISAYASQLSFGVSVAEYLKLPKFDAQNQLHGQIAGLSRDLSNNKRTWDTVSQSEIDGLVDRALHEPRS